MRSWCSAVLVALMLPGICLAGESPEIDDAVDRASYSLGYQIGGDLERQSAEIDGEALSRGLRDGLGELTPSIPPEEMKAILLGVKRNILIAQQRQKQRLLGRSSEEEPAELEVEEEKLSYSIGYKVGDDFRRQGVEIDSELVVKGARDGRLGASPMMTPDEMRLALTELKQQAEAAAKRQREEQALKNLAGGKAFLAENAKKEGVRTLPSGLQYQVITEGGGDPPTATDTVTVHYRGTSIDGTEFDSSYGRGAPATFPLDGVIPGWTESLQLMRPGAKHRLFIPPELAYGERGSGARIGPNSTLIFEVELLSVQRTE